jgi:hypothetical protein
MSKQKGDIPVSASKYVSLLLSESNLALARFSAVSRRLMKKINHLLVNAMYNITS